MIKISIITIAYNSASTIEDTIKSVVNQDYPNVEYIIVDGASKDDTLKIVQKYKDKIAKVISEKDKGIYDAMNKGVKLATGDVIGMLNSDDLLADTSILSKIAKAFENNNIDATYGDLTYVDRDNVEKITRKWLAKNYKKGDFLKGWMPPHPTFYLKNELYQKHGLYRTDLSTAADYELMLRMIHKNEIKVHYINEIIVKMRVGGESNVSLKNRIIANKNDRKAWEVNGLKPSPFTLMLKPLSKLSQFLKK
jgi:glycosyltransferase involved in cell wall biosynthesis